MNRIPDPLDKPARVPTSLKLIHWRRVLRQSGMAAFDAEPFMGRHTLIYMESLQTTFLQRMSLLLCAGKRAIFFWHFGGQIRTFYVLYWSNFGCFIVLFINIGVELVHFQASVYTNQEG